jgi:hypothetical protein
MEATPGAMLGAHAGPVIVGLRLCTDEAQI